MKFILTGVLILSGSYSVAAIQTGKLSGIDNYQSPCWVNIIEVKNEKESLLTNHQIKVTFSYSQDLFSLTHPIEQLNTAFRSVPEMYTGSTIKPNQADSTDIGATKAMATLNIDKDHTPISFGFYDNDGGEKEFKRRSFFCTLGN
ncbi:MAG: hypothetical protein SGJ18_15575 [Pseudomonadota bacterium]|nr:hypothetical protein [Pseudomonadota bacterium]